MNSCAFCGRGNDEGARYCMDCGKPLSPSAARGVATSSSVAAGGASGGAAVRATPLAAPLRPSSGHQGGGTCTSCGASIDASLPFCPICGQATGAGARSEAPCANCEGPIRVGVDSFCPRCGTRTASANGDSPGRPRSGLRLVLLDEHGDPGEMYALDTDLSVGRTDGEIRFPRDHYLSPLHAQFSPRDGQVVVRDLGSRNRTWVFLDAPVPLGDGDVILVGSQLLLFRRLGYPGPHPPEADATRRLGSLTPTADVAILSQLRADGSIRDTFHLSPGRHVTLGREEGDWIFPYDQTMSGRHAEIRSEDSGFILQDAGSRNGVAIAVRGEREVKRNQRVLVGDQLLRIETA